MADSTTPIEMVQMATEAGAKKAKLPIAQMLVLGALSGALLGISASLAITVWTQQYGIEFPVLGAVFFPVGFVVLVLMGFELVTGNFALILMAVYAGKASIPNMLNNWFWVTVGNLIGGVLYAMLFWEVYSNFGDNLEVPVGKKAKAIAMLKTVAYAKAGWHGWITAFLKAVACNWMVCMGTMMTFASKSTIGRIAGMWLPITVFFAHAYEHAVVNFFVIPAGMMYGAPVSTAQWWLNNQIPVLLGNLVGGFFLVGLPLAYAYPVKGKRDYELFAVDVVCCAEEQALTKSRDGEVAHDMQ
jgi:formate/nitrite transporter